MPKNISEFRASFKTELARTHRFDVDIVIPYLLLPVVDTARSLSLRCESTEMPGRTFQTTERKIGSTPTQYFPYQSSYNQLTATFIVGGDMKEKLFFDLWMELINPTTDFNFKYKKDYVSDIAINQYDLRNELTYRAVLLDAFPVSVNQLDLDWSSDGYHKLTVVFAYNNWTVGTVADIAQNFYVQGLSGLDAFLQG